MSSSSSSDPASTRVSACLSSRVLLTLVCLLTIALVGGCTEAGDANATSDDSAFSTEEDPTPQENQNSNSDDEEDAEAAAEDSEDSSEGGENDSPEARRTRSTATGTARAMRDDLTDKGRAPKTGYDPDLFKWRSDADHNGCDTRNDVLRRDLKNITIKAGTKGCVVIAGDLA